MKRFLPILPLLLIPLLSSAQEFPTGLSEFQYDGQHFYAVANNERRIVKLDQPGKLVHTFGNSGRGPGEFQDEYLKYVLHDSLLYIADGLAQKVVVIDKHTFELRDEITVKKMYLTLLFIKTKYLASFSTTKSFQLLMTISGLFLYAL